MNEEHAIVNYSICLTVIGFHILFQISGCSNTDKESSVSYTQPLKVPHIF